MLVDRLAPFRTTTSLVPTSRNLKTFQQIDCLRQQDSVPISDPFIPTWSRIPGQISSRRLSPTVSQSIMSLSTPQTVRLSPIDDAQPCGFVRTILAFPTHDSVDVVKNDLERGVNAITSKWPHLRGQLVHRDGPDPRGRFMIQLNPSASVKVTIKQLSRSQFPHSYEELSRRRVPIAMLEEKMLCAVPDPAVPGPATIVQANFIHGGGLLLSICLHHCVVDGEGTRLIIEEFARGCRTPHPIIQRPCTIGQHVNFQESSKELSRHPVYKSYQEAIEMTLPSPRLSPTALEPYSPEPSISSEASEDEDQEWCNEDNKKTNLLLTFSDCKLKQLKAAISGSLQTDSAIDQTLVQRLSTNDCLASLLWQGITRARTPDLTATQSSFFLAVDGRTKIVPQIDPQYTSAAVIHSIATTSTRAIKRATCPSLLGPLSLAIRSSIQAVDDTYIADTVALINSFPNMRKFGIRKTANNDLLMTTWEKFAYQDMDFGGALGKPEWARKPWSQQVADIVVLPKSAEGDEIEVVLLLSRGQVRRLLGDEDFMGYVEHYSD